MTASNHPELEGWLVNMAALIKANGDPMPEHYQYFLNDPTLSLKLVSILDGIDESTLDADETYYTACVFALDICVAQLQAAIEMGSKAAEKLLEQLMINLADKIASHQHSLSFWLPALNAFYEAHVELAPALQDAYLELAEQDSEFSDITEEDTLRSMQEMLNEFKGLSTFEIAEHIFSQSYAMPPEFFGDFLQDLFQVEGGSEVGILMLLHPNDMVREVVAVTFDGLLATTTLSSRALTRLKSIQHWYPERFHAAFERWIKAQRKKGVVFIHPEPTAPHRLEASEVDGSGAQGLFIQVTEKRKKRLCGLLLKQGVGIKDVWMTPPVTKKEIDRYHDEAFQDSISLRPVEMDYLMLLTNHFLAVSHQNDQVPSMHLLQIEEALGVSFVPKLIDVEGLMMQLAVQITPFTEELIEQSLKRSYAWPKSKKFTESWYCESPLIDKHVNRHCEIVEGVKVCHFPEAMAIIFEEVFEKERDYWQFHFLWLALWLKSAARKNEKMWLDAFLIAYVIAFGKPLEEIPILKEICYQSVINSVETMNERRTHLLVQ